MLAIPIETAARELDYKLMLAVDSLPWTGSSVVGRLDALVRLARFAPRLTFVGKLFEPTFPDSSLHRLRAMRRAGWRVVYVDEEGAFFLEELGSSLDQRLDPNVLGRDDVVCCWGAAQQAHYEQMTGDDGPRIVNVGHPRFDLLASRYASFFAPEVEALRNRFGTYYLINTSFSPGNHGSSALGRFGPTPRFRPGHLGDMLEWADSASAIVAIQRRVALLADEYPDLHFVVRPHPSEHLSGYDALRGFANVTVERSGSVIPWILGSAGMMHAGCTTAVEGMLAGKPVLRFDVEFPTSGGPTDLLFALGHPVDSAFGEPVAGPSAAEVTAPPALVDLIDNFRTPSFPRLLDLLQDVDAGMRPPGRTTLRRAARLAGRASDLAWFASDVRGRISPDRRRHFTYSAAKFPGFGELDLEARVARIAAMTGVGVSVQFVSRDLALLEAA